SLIMDSRNDLNEQVQEGMLPILPNGKNWHVFLVSASKDRTFARNFSAQMEAFSFRTMLHERDYIPGVTVISNIQMAIRKSKGMILILTENFEVSNWCKYEAQQGVQEMINSNGEFKVIAVRSGIREVPSYLKWLPTFESNNPHLVDLIVAYMNGDENILERQTNPDEETHRGVVVTHQHIHNTYNFNNVDGMVHIGDNSIQNVSARELALYLQGATIQKDLTRAIEMTDKTINRSLVVTQDTQDGESSRLAIGCEANDASYILSNDVQEPWYSWFIYWFNE
ncbi:unnamed protein product, partial [Owenia fusiformis]